jgi:phospholipid N-methyltransferase
MMSDPVRFLDALRRTYSAEELEQTQNVLIFGPGLTDPLDELLAMFPQAAITAVEADQETAQKLASRFEGNPRLRILNDDAASLSDSTAGTYDLMIARHPDVARYMEQWQQAFQRGADSVRVGGLLVASVYSLPEASFIDMVMADLPVTMRPGTPYTAVPVPLQGNDRYILIYERT